jgi:hypothetical protein
MAMQLACFVAALALGQSHGPTGPEATEKRYAEIDAYALNAPRDAEASIATLAAYLSKAGASEREKARAIFTWVAEKLAYDTDAVSAGFADQRFELVLNTRKTHCGGYSWLFEQLGRAAGLTVNSVVGEVRTLDHAAAITDPWTHFGPNGSFYGSHCWDAIKLDGSWYLVDCTAASPNELKGGQVHQYRPFDPYYFLLPPKTCLCSYLPQEPDWQLVDTPLSRENQSRLPLKTTGFYRWGMTMKGIADAPINGGDQLCRVEYDVDPAASPFAELRRNGEVVPGGAFTFTNRNGSHYETFVSAPEKGAYTFRILTKTPKSEHHWDIAVDYRLNASQGMVRPKGFPTQTNEYRDSGARLVSPDSGELTAGTSYTFEISIDGVLGVGVLTGGQIVPLENRGNTWVGTATAGSGDLWITAQFPDRPDWNAGLVKYSVP